MVKKSLIASIIIFFSLNAFAENYEVDINGIENSVIQKEKEIELKFIEKNNLGDTDYKKFITGEKKFKKKPTNEMSDDELLYLAFIARIKSNVNEILKEKYKEKYIQKEKEKNLKNNSQIKNNLSYIDDEVSEYLNSSNLDYNKFIEKVNIKTNPQNNELKYINVNSNIYKKDKELLNPVSYNIKIRNLNDNNVDFFEKKNICLYFDNQISEIYENTIDNSNKEAFKIYLSNEITKNRKMTLDDKLLFSSQLKSVLTDAYNFDRKNGDFNTFKTEIHNNCSKDLLNNITTNRYLLLK